MVELYLHSLIRLHGGMLNYVITGTNIPLPFTEGLCSRGAKRSEREADHSPPSSVENENT
jgi:hypothetical protein